MGLHKGYVRVVRRLGVMYRGYMGGPLYRCNVNVGILQGLCLRNGYIRVTSHHRGQMGIVWRSRRRLTSMTQKEYGKSDGNHGYTAVPSRSTFTKEN